MEWNVKELSWFHTKEGKERNKWIKEELKDQALKLFKSATFNDGMPENNFKVEWDFENLDDADKKRYLGDIATDPQKLCGCANVPECEPIKENLRWNIKNNNIRKYLVPDPISENKSLPLLFKGNFYVIKGMYKVLNFVCLVSWLFIYFLIRTTTISLSTTKLFKFCIAVVTQIEIKIKHLNM